MNQLEVIDPPCFTLSSFEYVEPPDGAYGAFVNGSWNGLVRMVIAGVSIYQMAAKLYT